MFSMDIILNWACKSHSMVGEHLHVVFRTVFFMRSRTCARLVIPVLSYVLCVSAPYDLQIKHWRKDEVREIK